MPGERVGRRHDLLRLAPGGATHAGSAVAIAALDAWIARDWPVIRARGPRDVPVAVSLPIGSVPRRIGFVVPPATVRRCSRPPLLAEVLERASWSRPWRRVAEAVVAAGQEAGAPPRVFGSVLWQHVTGLPHVGPRSDLDCLWEDVAPARLPALLRTLRRIDGARGDGAPRLDGEIVFGDLGAVNWRELADEACGDSVLVKDETGARLLARASLGGTPG